jgi:CBS domain-containing protein
MGVMQLFLPTLSAIIAEGSDVPIMDPSATALDAARLMLEKKRSAGPFSSCFGCCRRQR